MGRAPAAPRLLSLHPLRPRLSVAQAGFTEINITLWAAFFRLLSRRLLNALQFFPGPLMLVAAIFLVPPALVLPLFDPWTTAETSPRLHLHRPPVHKPHIGLQRQRPGC